MNSPSLLDRLERRFDRFAIPGLLRVVASFQVICFLLIYAKPGFQEVLMLTPAAWTKWEIWRFFTFCFIPGTRSLFWIFLVIPMLLLVGDVLEYEWGKFRQNLYYFGSVVALWGSMALFGPGAAYNMTLIASSVLYANLFLAFATESPNHVLRLYFILPVQAKWLALLMGLGFAFMIFTIPIIRFPLALALLPYGLYALPIAYRRFRHGARVTVRRATFQADSMPKGQAFHECKVCGRTEISDPTLEFRIAGDDEEYCAEHLPAGPA